MKNKISKLDSSGTIINNNQVNTRPPFYQSLSSTTPFLNRGLSFNFDSNTPIVQEIVGATRSGSGSLTFLYKNSYLNTPFVSGVVKVNNANFFTIPLVNTGNATPPYIQNYIGSKGTFIVNIVTANAKDLVTGKLRIYNLFTDKYGFLPSV